MSVTPAVSKQNGLGESAESTVTNNNSTEIAVADGATAGAVPGFDRCGQPGAPEPRSGQRSEVRGRRVSGRRRPLRRASADPAKGSWVVHL